MGFSSVSSPKPTSPILGRLASQAARAALSCLAAEEKNFEKDPNHELRPLGRVSRFKDDEVTSAVSWEYARRDEAMKYLSGKWHKARKTSQYDIIAEAMAPGRLDAKAMAADARHPEIPPHLSLPTWMAIWGCPQFPTTAWAHLSEPTRLGIKTAFAPGACTVEYPIRPSPLQAILSQIPQSLTASEGNPCGSALLRIDFSRAKQELLDGVRQWLTTKEADAVFNHYRRKRTGKDYERDALKCIGIVILMEDCGFTCKDVCQALETIMASGLKVRGFLDGEKPSPRSDRVRDLARKYPTRYRHLVLPWVTGLAAGQPGPFVQTFNKQLHGQTKPGIKRKQKA